MNEDTLYEGIVSQVGKAAGKDKNRCWIKFADGIIKSFDFTDEIQDWKIITKSPEKDQTAQEEDNINVTHYTEHTDKDVQKKENEILIIKIPKKAVKDINRKNLIFH